MTNALCMELANQFSGFIAGSMDCGSDLAGLNVITTPFLYPDRDNIEIFVRELEDGSVLLSDMGQTMMKLSSYGFIPSASTPRRRAMIFQVVASMGVQYEDGDVVAVSPRMQTGSRLWDLALAIQRLSDLVYTVPGYTKATFTDEFDQFAAEKGIRYRRGVTIELPNHSFTADFIIGPRVIQLVSAGSIGYARERVNSVYTNFAEMKLAKDPRIRLAVVDDRQPTIDTRMRSLLRNQADQVLAWTRKAELERALTSAA
jgi:hypothetical protein